MTPDFFQNAASQTYWQAFHEARQIVGDKWAAVAGETARQAVIRGRHDDQTAIKVGILHAFEAKRGGAYPFPVVVNGDGPRAA